MAATRGHRSSAWLLALAMLGLIVYASLHPFGGWQWPAQATWRQLLLPPWTTYWTRFDILANLLAYMPIGALVCGALLREGASRRRAFAVAALAGVALSWLMEVLQNLLPTRVPSLADWGLNSAGALLGALLALAALALGWVERWQVLRERWLAARGGAAALSLLLLWPVGLLFPPSLPLGLGQVLPRINAALAEALEATPFEGWIEAPADQLWLPLSPGAEALAIALGLLAPVWVAYSVSHPGWRRLALLAGAVVLGLGATTLSTALNFGPDHALAWLTAPVLPAAVGAVVLAVLLAWMPRRGAAGLGLVAITALLALVNQAPADPYFAESLQGWEQGRFIRFHGLAQWVGWLWPYGALAYLLARVAGRRDA